MANSVGGPVIAPQREGSLDHWWLLRRRIVRWMRSLAVWWMAYRVIMRVAHRFNWHYAPPIYPEGDVQLWCKWCGFRMTLPKDGL